MHRLSFIRIENFRACRDVSIPLEAYTPLVGLNNAGKSTILRSIKWVLKPSTLSSTDFFDQNIPVVITACIEGVTPELLTYLPEQKHRKAIEPYCKEEKFWIRVKTTFGSKPIQEVWDVQQYSGHGVPDQWRGYPTGLPQAVSILLPDPLHVEAMDDIGEDLGKTKSGTTIKVLLDEIMEPILEAHEELIQALDVFRAILTTDGKSRSTFLSDFDKSATEVLEHFFPGLSIDLDLQVIEIKELFRAGNLHVTDSMTLDRRRFDQMGTGAQRSIQMALIRYLAEMRNRQAIKPARRLLLIDEPELYLHPQGVRRLRQALSDLSNSGFQVIFSSHSPLMLSRENAACTLLVKKSAENGVTVKKPLRQAVIESLMEAESQSRALFELGNLVDIYFAEKVVLCEGKTDRRLLPLLYEKIYGRHPEVDHIAFLSLGSCSDIPKALPVLASMGIQACAVADLDFAYVDARKGSQSLLDKDGEDLKDVKRILSKLKGNHGFFLGDNGLPKKSKEWLPSDIWAIFAKDVEGEKICFEVHNSLRKHNIWVWPVGCIEHVTKYADKGEDAIIEQENILHGMNAEEISKAMPLFVECFKWIVESQTN